MPEDIEQYCNEAEQTFKALSKIQRHTSRLFEGDPDLSKIANEFIHAKTFFEVMGFEQYVDIDNFEYDQQPFLQPLLIFARPLLKDI